MEEQIQPPISNKRTSRLPTYLLILILVVISPFALPQAFFGALEFLAPDIAVPQDSAYLPKPLVIFHGENAYFDLDQASSAMPVLTNEDTQHLSDYVYGKDWDDARVWELLSQSAKSLVYARHAAQQKVFQDPLFEDPANISYDMQIHSVTMYREIGGVWTLRALALLHDGNSSAAADEALGVVALGTLIMDEPHSITKMYMAGLSIKKLGLDALTNIAHSPTTSHATKTRIAKSLGAYRDDGKGLEGFFKIEYLLQKKELRDLRANNFTSIVIAPIPVNVYSFMPNQTLDYLIQNAQENIASIGVACAVDMPQKRNDFLSIGPTDPHAKIRLGLIRNANGKMFHDATVGMLKSELHSKRCVLENEIDIILQNAQR